MDEIMLNENRTKKITFKDQWKMMSKSCKAVMIACFIAIAVMSLFIDRYIAVWALMQYADYGNAERRAYTEARKEEAKDYDTWTQQLRIKFDIDEKKLIPDIAYTEEITRPLPKIVVKDNLNENYCKAVVAYTLDRMPRSIQRAIIENYKIVFVSGAIETKTDYQTVGLNDAVNRTITIANTGEGMDQMAVNLTHEIGHMIFAQNVEKFVNAGYVRRNDLPQGIWFHQADNSYSQIYPEFMAQAFAEYIWYPESLYEQAPEFFETMRDVISEFEYNPWIL